MAARTSATGSEGSRRPERRRVAYHRILVPVGTPLSEQAVTVACRLAAEHGATVTALSVIEVPVELPLDAHMTDEETEARRLLAAARGIGDQYGVHVVTRAVRAREAGQAIVEEAAAGGSQLVVLRAARRPSAGRRSSIFGQTADFVLKHAPCRVLVAAR